MILKLFNEQNKIQILLLIILAIKTYYLIK